jgi:hypothetical protein
MHFYKFHLPQSSPFQDEYEDFIQSSFVSRMDEGIYRSQRDYEDDDNLPIIPNGTYQDQIPIDNKPITSID